MSHWDRVLESYNYWGAYRNEDWVDINKAWVIANWRRKPGADNPAPDLPVLAPAAPRRGAIQDLVQPPVPVLTAAEKAFQQAFIDSTPSPLTASWTGRKFLGAGGFGAVGMWEYTGPPADAPDRTQVAVKEVHAAEYDLAAEGAIMTDLGAGRSRHVVNLVMPPIPIDAAADGLDPEWDGVVKRLIMEYCSMGDLRGLWSRRVQMQKDFKEVTLWAMFNCLVDGVSRMADGQDIIYNDNLPADAAAQRVQPPGSGAWDEIVHFDIKGENILLGARDNRHQSEPVFKFSDFGAAQKPRDPGGQWTIPQDQVASKERWRRLGTEGLFVPEQFTERWDYYDFDRGGIAGRYTYKTNIWGIGSIMHSMALLAEEPSVREPFIPGLLNGAAAKGIAYGYNLHSLPIYSTALKDLIVECLYQDPEHRPGLEELKNRVVAGLDNAIHADAIHEPWEEFLAYDDPAYGAARTANAAQIAAQVAAQQQQSQQQQTAAAALLLANAIAHHALARDAFNGTTMRCHPRTKNCNNKFRTDGVRFRCNQVHEITAGVINPYPNPPPVPPENYFTGARIQCSLDQCFNEFLTDGIETRCSLHRNLVNFPVGMVQDAKRRKRKRRRR